MVDEIRWISGPRGRLEQGATAVISTVRNEADILPAFLDHYRKMGVQRFFFIDNASDDETPRLLREQPDVCLYHAPGSYHAALCGNAWVNQVAGRHCMNRWTLVVDADEFLILPGGIPELRDFTRRMEDNLDFGLFCPMVEFFPPDITSRPARTWDSLESLIAGAPCFMPFNPACLRILDEYPYVELKALDGIRAALDSMNYAPRLNKIPLVFWRSGFRFTRSTHEGGAMPLSMETGVLCHFKFRRGFAERVKEKRRGDDRQNPQAIFAYLEKSRSGHISRKKLSGARSYGAAGDLARTGWLSWPGGASGAGGEETPPGGTLPELWRRANLSRRRAFAALAADPQAWERMDESLTARRTRFFMERLVRLRTVRASYPLRRWLWKRGLLQPQHMPEEAGIREPAEHIALFYESFWWDIGAPVRLLRGVSRAIRWKRLWLRITGRGGKGGKKR